MYTNRTLANGRYGLLFIVLLWLYTSSCGSDSQKQPSNDTKSTSQTSVSEFKANCVILDSAEVARWVDAGYTKPGSDSLMKYILLQNYSPDADRADTNNVLLSYAATEIARVVGPSIRLRTSPRCVGQPIVGEIAITNNYVRLEDLPIFNTDGSLKPFAFIRFIPVRKPEFKPYLSYDFEVVSVSSGTEQVIYKSSQRGRGTDPCPPYCGIS